jgi:hypothetical protein
LKKARVQLAWVNNQRYIQRFVEKIVANKHVQTGKKHAPIGMCVVPPHHLDIGWKLLALPSDLLPGVMRKLETSLGTLVMSSAQAVGDKHKRPAILIVELPPQQDAA